jgi:8-oxo-dGTP pyrophosphatase MutT (NUDIX family)
MSAHRPRPSRSETWKGGALVEEQTRMQQQGAEAPGDMTGDRANPWTVHRKEESFACSFFSVRSDTVAHGTRLPRVYNSVRMTSSGVSIAPIDDEGCITLVGQYRYVLDRFTWELPGGGCKLDQTPMEAASMELSEETGYRADHLLQLFDASLAPGTMDGRTQCFVAWGLHSGLAHPEPEERLLQRRAPFSQAISMALSGEISNFSSVTLLLGIQVRLARGELPATLAMLLRQ